MISLVIPVYNEAKIIKDNITKIIDFLNKQKYKWEIVIVDDGSIDETIKIVDKFVNSKVRLVKLVKNSGKGAALRAGVKNSKGEYVVFTDADLSVPITYLNPILDNLQMGYPVVIGSRRVEGAIIEKHQPFFRELAGRFHTRLAQVFTGAKISDFTCGFKGFEAEAGKKIFSKSLIDRWSYDDEILFLAQKFGFAIKEVPINWINRSDSRVTMGSAMITSFLDLFKIRLNYFNGKYN